MEARGAQAGASKRKRRGATTNLTAGLAALLIALLAAASSVQALSIGVNFVGSNTAPMGAGETAGAAPQVSWNNAAGATGTLAALLDSAGCPTGVAVAWSGSPNTYNTSIADTPGNNRLMRGYLDTSSDSTTTIALTGVPYANYYVLTYFDGDNGDKWRTANYTISAAGFGSLTVRGEDDDDNTPTSTRDFDGRFRHLDGARRGNYAIHAMLPGQASFTLTATPVDSEDNNIKRAPINGLQIVDLGTPATRINLADVVGGGNGLGTGTPGGRIVPGAAWTLSAHPYVDGTFTPNAKRSQQIDGAGRQHDFSSQASGVDAYGDFVNGVGDISNPYDPANVLTGVGDFKAVGRAILSAHPQKGITFDLDAIRRDHPLADLTHFTMIVGDSRKNTDGSISYFVLLDGEVKASGFGLTNMEEFVWVDIARENRFLTLVTTDADSGDDRSCDHAYFGDPFVHFVAVAHVPEPSALALLLSAAVGMAWRRARRRRGRRRNPPA